MDILLERTKEKQAPTPTGEPVTLAPRIGAGRVVRYFVRPGQQVAKDATLARVLDAGELPVDIAAPFAGKVAELPYGQGDTFPAGAAIAYLVSIDAPQAPQRATTTRATNHTAPAGKAPQRTTGAASEASYNNGEIEQASYNGYKIEQPAPSLFLENSEPAPLPIVQDQPARRSTMSPAIELTIIEEEPVTPPAPKKQKREKTRHHTTHLTPSQIRRVKKLGQRLDLEDVVPGCGEAELMRAAIEMLLDLPEPALLAVIEKNRAKEKAGGYGTGYRRGPSK